MVYLVRHEQDHRERKRAMSVFSVPRIDISEINDLEKVKAYLDELNKKIRYLSENVDHDNMAPAEYRKFYQNGDKAIELVHTMDSFLLKLEDAEKKVHSAIEQTSRQIDLYVNSYEAVNAVSVSTEKIKISGTALEVNSKNFLLDDKGNLKLSGEIYAEAGNFGGFQIARDEKGEFLSGDTISACGLSGTTVNVRRRLDITTDNDITGCHIDFSNCNVQTSNNTYFGWFYCENVVCTSAVYANCGQCNEAYIDGLLECYDVFSNYLSIAWSDRRLKKDIAPIENALEYILSLRPVEYKLKGYEGYHYGFIAQELLSGGDPYNLVSTMENGYYAVNYDGLHGVICKAIQELEEMKNAL